MSIISNIINTYEKQFNMQQAYAINPGVNKESVRARVYEAATADEAHFNSKIIDNKLIYKISRGVYGIKTVVGEGEEPSSCVLLEGDGLDLSFIQDKSIDAIVTDHPYDIKASNNGGDRHFATYDCFRYTQHDFDEKSRVLKDGCFLVEFLPEESANNYEYIYDIKKMAEKAGFKYYAAVPWKKGDFIANTGRKSKNTETVMIFSKGEARALRPDAKKDKADPSIKHYMKGAAGMLPTVFDYAKTSKKDTIHQAEKPVALIQAILEYITLPNEIVLDQFAGSGVTGEACLKSKRECILIELAHEFCEKIISRLKLKKISA